MVLYSFLQYCITFCNIAQFFRIINTFSRIINDFFRIIFSEIPHNFDFFSASYHHPWLWHHFTTTTSILCEFSFIFKFLIPMGIDRTICADCATKESKESILVVVHDAIIQIAYTSLNYMPWLFIGLTVCIFGLFSFLLWVFVLHVIFSWFVCLCIILSYT